jgi:hypothetical protein
MNDLILQIIKGKIDAVDKNKAVVKKLENT